MFNKFMFTSSAVAMALTAAAMGIEGTDFPHDTTPHHLRRGNGHRITGFDGEMIRQMNRTNGVGARFARISRDSKRQLLAEIGAIDPAL